MFNKSRCIGDKIYLPDDLPVFDGKKLNILCTGKGHLCLDCSWDEIWKIIFFKNLLH